MPTPVTFYSKTGSDGTFETQVVHGSTAGTARPTTTLSVMWVGTVTPTNAANGDTYLNSGTGDEKVKVAGSFIPLNQATNTATFVTTVNHGSSGSYPRPAGALIAQWFGSVAPTNATSIDRWLNTNTLDEKMLIAGQWREIGQNTFPQPAGKSTTGVAAPLPWFNGRDYGMVLDGVTDDSAALTAALTAASDGGTVFIPAIPGSSPTKFVAASPVAIPGNVTLNGGSRDRVRMIATGTGGVTIASGLSNVTIREIGIFTPSGNYPTNTNTAIGIQANGTDASPISNLVLDRVTVQGFGTGVQLTSVDGSSFMRVAAYSNLVGFDVYGLTENNVMTQCYVDSAWQTGGPALTSFSVRFNGTTSPSNSTPDTSEGWMITKNVFAHGNTNIALTGVRNFSIIGNIIDWSKQYGIFINSNATYYSGAHQIVGNYIAVGTSIAGAAAIYNANAVAVAQPGPGAIANNSFMAYAGTDPVSGSAMTCASAIQLAGSNAAQTITGNTSGGFASQDLLIGSALTVASVVTGNIFKSATTNQIADNSTVPNVIANNVGKVNYGTPTTLAAGANAGTSPPAPVRTSNTQLATGLTFGTGTTPAAGTMVAVTFGQPRTNTPRSVQLTAGNAATASLLLYVVPGSLSTTGFSIGVVNAPTASQANTTYSVYFNVIE